MFLWKMGQLDYSAIRLLHAALHWLNLSLSFSSSLRAGKLFLLIARNINYSVSYM